MIDKGKTWLNIFLQAMNSKILIYINDHVDYKQTSSFDACMDLFIQKIKCSITMSVTLKGQLALLW